MLLTDSIRIQARPEEIFGVFEDMDRHDRQWHPDYVSESGGRRAGNDGDYARLPHPRGDDDAAFTPEKIVHACRACCKTGQGDLAPTPARVLVDS